MKVIDMVANYFGLTKKEAKIYINGFHSTENLEKQLNEYFEKEAKQSFYND